MYPCNFLTGILLQRDFLYSYYSDMFIQTVVLSGFYCQAEALNVFIF